jgi:hypothetical protein
LSCLILIYVCFIEVWDMWELWLGLCALMMSGDPGRPDALRQVGGPALSKQGKGDTHSDGGKAEVDGFVGWILEEADAQPHDAWPLPEDRSMRQNGHSRKHPLAIYREWASIWAASGQTHQQLTNEQLRLTRKRFRTMHTTAHQEHLATQAALMAETAAPAAATLKPSPWRTARTKKTRRPRPPSPPIAPTGPSEISTLDSSAREGRLMRA